MTTQREQACYFALLTRWNQLRDTRALFCAGWYARNLGSAFRSHHPRRYGPVP